MILINGLPGDSMAVSDRGLHYGDGLFETLAVSEGRPELWARHIQRLRHGCERLAIPMPDPALLRDEVEQVCASVEKNKKMVLKLILTRGSGGRGYRPPKPPRTTRIVAIYPWPDYPEAWRREGVMVRICRQRLALNPALAGIKHLNRLEQVLARQEWDDPAIAEGLMLDLRDRVVEGAQTNLFLVRDGRLLTSDLAEAGIAGVMRGLILDMAPDLGCGSEITSLKLDDVKQAQELFLCNSIIGLWPVRCLESMHFRAPGPVTARIDEAVEKARRS